MLSKVESFVALRYLRVIGVVGILLIPLLDVSALGPFRRACSALSNYDDSQKESAQLGETRPLKPRPN